MTEITRAPVVRKTKASRRRVAVLDLNNGVPNLGLRSIVELVKSAGDSPGRTPVSVEVFDVRGKGELPGTDFDAFISSGGPGSPFDGEGSPWESRYFRWLETAHKLNIPTMLICHSFELMIRHFGLAAVLQRRSPSFGIFPVHPTAAAKRDPVFGELDDPFYAADFRDWQVVDADRARFKELDAAILAREKYRSHVPLERAIMAVRVGPSILGVQFHPEASPDGMASYFQREEKVKSVVETYGARRLSKMLALLKEPEALARTNSTIIPGFLNSVLSPA